MKKGILFIFVVVVAVVAFNVNLNTSEKTSFSSLELANIEALAQNESGGMTLDCWDTVTNDRGWGNVELSTHKTYCGSCKPVLVTSYEDASTCKM